MTIIFEDKYISKISIYLHIFKHIVYYINDDDSFCLMRGSSCFISPIVEGILMTIPLKGCNVNDTMRENDSYPLVGGEKSSRNLSMA